VLAGRLTCALFFYKWSRVVGIDCRAQLVFDSMEMFATKLCQFSLDRSVGSGGVCVGVDDLRRVARKEVSQRKRKRISQ
jgi:hypothetical protein